MLINESNGQYIIIRWLWWQADANLNQFMIELFLGPSMDFFVTFLDFFIFHKEVHGPSNVV